MLYFLKFSPLKGTFSLNNLNLFSIIYFFYNFNNKNFIFIYILVWYKIFCGPHDFRSILICTINNIKLVMYMWFDLNSNKWDNFWYCYLVPTHRNFWENVTRILVRENWVKKESIDISVVKRTISYKQLQDNDFIGYVTGLEGSDIFDNW